MIRVLDGLILLKEIDDLDCDCKKSQELKELYPDKVFVIRHHSYIYSDVLCEETLKRVTILDNYVTIGELSEILGVRREVFFRRIEFMQKIGERWFEFL